MPSAPCDPSIVSTTLSHRSATLADALFASALQRADHPTPGQIRHAIAATAAAYGGSGCVARVAQAFGEHPETAVTRMRWARALAARVVPATCLAA